MAGQEFSDEDNEYTDTRSSVYRRIPNESSLQTSEYLSDEERELDNEEITDQDLDMTGDDLSHKANPHNQIFYEVFFVVLPIFCGYATLFSLQSQVKSVMGISDCDNSASRLFGVACSFLYLGNLVFRMGHNFFFYFAAPRIRVLISMGAMALSMLTLAVVLFFTKENTNISAVFIAYGLGGLSVGSFEANILSSITPLGKDTKIWAILAMPIGINIITIGGFIALTFSFIAENPGIIHVLVMCSVLCGIGIYLIRIFGKASLAVHNFSVKQFLHGFKDMFWLKIISWNCLSLMVDMFFVSMFSPGVILYIYDSDTVHLGWIGVDLDTDLFIAIYNFYFFMGDTCSRQILYNAKRIFPVLFLILSMTGMVLGLSSIPEIVPICAFFVSFANGSIYAQSNRLIDMKLPDKLNLTALSTWLFVGDIGSVVGSNLIQYVSEWYRKKHGTGPIC